MVALHEEMGEARWGAPCSNGSFLGKLNATLMRLGPNWLAPFLLLQDAYFAERSILQLSKEIHLDMLRHGGGGGGNLESYRGVCRLPNQPSVLC